MTTIALKDRFYQNSPDSSYVLRRGDVVVEPSYALKDVPSTSSSVIDAISSRVSARSGTLANARMNSELTEILKQLHLAATETGIDLSLAPPFEIVDADDGSVLIEWHFADRRLGFNIEPQQGQSGWYFAFSRTSGGQCGSGLLASLDMRVLLPLMFQTPTR
jgi:hypothetical protein